MAGVDTSIYGQVAPPPDPFAIPGKILALKQGMLGLGTSQIENQLLQRRLQGDQALQDAYSAPGAVSDTGETNIPIVRNALIGSPAAVGIPDEVRRAQGNVGGNIANTKGAFDLSNDQNVRVGQMFGAAAQAGTLNNWKDALGIVLSAKESGVISPRQANTMVHDLQTRGGDVKSWANNHFIYTLPNQGSQPTQIGVTPSGAPITGTTAQAITKAVGAVPTDAAGNALNPDGSPTSKNYDPKTKTVTPPAAAKPAPTMGFQSGLAPGQASSAGISAESAAQQAAAFEKQANAAVDNKATIANMQDQLAKVATGPYADRINNAKAGYNELVDAAGLPLPQFDKTKIAALDEFRKNGQILANQQFATLGGTGTDAQLSAAVHSNPGTFMSNLSNKQIMQMLQGNQDAIEAKATAWRQYQKQAGAQANFNTFSEDFNRSYSPRAFQFVHMTPDERKDMVKSMTPVEKGQLNTALQTAMDRGWINAPEAAK